MTAPRVTLYFDIGSPFSYIAFHALKVSPDARILGLESGRGLQDR